MDRIDIRGIEAFGYHGVLPHERDLGQRFVVDVGLGLDLESAGRSDNLSDTVNYGAITQVVVALVTDRTFQLLEALATAIADACLEYDEVEVAEVSVHKPSAPVPGLVDDVVVTIRRVRPT
ncbi:MAG: dihydroneopterin aldolase [Nitriliruptoraceae bacterium]